MGGIEWRAIHGVDQFQLGEARVRAHFAAQWLARVARAYDKLARNFVSAVAPGAIII